MATYDNSYSRTVAWLKVVLPLLALAILSTLFLVSRSIDPSQSIPFADGGIQELAREQGIGDPTYSGVTENGSAITVTADSAKPEPTNNDGMSASNLLAIIETPDGERVEITAPSGKLENVAKTVELAGGVTFDTSTGFNVVTDSALARLDLSELSTTSTITATGPFGKFTAGKMVMTQQTDEGSKDSYVLVFTGGVNLIYDPEQ